MTFPMSRQQCAVGIFGQRACCVSRPRDIDLVELGVGPYRVVRHPMYLGYLVTDIGFLVANFGVRNVVIVVAQWARQAVRTLKEEQLLSKDATYRDYMSRVCYRPIRGVF